MISIYTFFTIMLFCLLGTYLLSIQYVKYLRGEASRRVRDFDLMLTSILFGAPVALVMWLCFKEIRQEDKLNKYRLLIVTIILSVIQIIIIVLLFYFNIIELAKNEDETNKVAINLLMRYL